VRRRAKGSGLGNFDPNEVDECFMKRITQMKFYRLGAIARIRMMKAGDAVTDWRDEFSNIEYRLRFFARSEGNDELIPDSCRRAEDLIKSLESFRNAPGHEAPIVQEDVDLLGKALERFENTLENDLARLPTYRIENVGAYSVDKLISQADDVFTPGAKAKMPTKALEDFKKAGACLASDLPTACGFHAFRSADAMIRAYYTHFIGNSQSREPRDWGGYIRAFRAAQENPATVHKPNIRTIELLDSIRAIDRNPVIHPELDLDADTAIATFELCKSAIMLMAMDIITT
jgi:hypothetical protein